MNLGDNISKSLNIADHPFFTDHLEKKVNYWMRLKVKVEMEHLISSVIYLDIFGKIYLTVVFYY